MHAHESLGASHWNSTSSTSRSPEARSGLVDWERSGQPYLRHRRRSPSVRRAARLCPTATRTRAALVEAEEGVGAVVGGTREAQPPSHPGTSCPQAVEAAVLVVAVVPQVLVDPTCTDYGRHYLQLATLLVPVRCTLGAAQGADCTTPRLGKPWYLLAVKERDHHTVAWGRLKNQTRTRSEGQVRSASHQRNVRWIPMACRKEQVSGDFKVQDLLGMAL